jgi:hypothetical protein
MVGFIWNSDGFKDPAKHLTINEAIREQKLDFMVIFESGRDNFSAPFLKHLYAGLDFTWYCLPPRGRSGGILAGFNSATVVVENVVLSSISRIRVLSQDTQKPGFLAKLVRICAGETLPSRWQF